MCRERLVGSSIAQISLVPSGLEELGSFDIGERGCDGYDTEAALSRLG